MWRAPLLPAALLDDPGRAARDPLAAAALAQASPQATKTRDPAGLAAARGRYLRRAAFRPTPQGAWAGVGLGRLGARTAFASGPRQLVGAPSWGQLAALGRALLDDPALREGVRLRRTPSLLWRHERLTWLAADAGGAAQHHADADLLVEALLDACESWCSWADARAVAAHVEPAEAAALDELMLTLVDDGLLLTDLTPPLVGPPPTVWARARLEALLGGPAAAAQLAELPDDAQVLVHTPARPPTLARAAVERAARLAPLLFRLGDALAPPAAERHLDDEIGALLDAVTEPFGAGALDVAALALGDYGREPTTAGEPEAATAAPPAALVALLVGRVTEALAGKAGTPARFSAEELDAVTPALDAPESFELVLAPRREAKGAAAGTGWLVGVHAPAGASWGRFAHALGDGGRELLGELAAAETAACPDEVALDVAWHAAPALAELTCVPPTRAATLALTSWPEGAPAVTPAGLELVADAGAAAPMAWRLTGGAPVRPSGHARVRAVHAPRGLFRLMAAWPLWRQHAPWALAAGPTAALGRAPRVEIDGFVVAPASWALPALGASGVAGAKAGTAGAKAGAGGAKSGAAGAKVARAALARWRKAEALPRWVQVGQEDELLPVDLAAPEAADELERARRAGATRVWEIWPPLGDERGVDAGGRRIEAVVAVVRAPAAEERAARAAVAAAGRVAPPEAPAPGWRTFILHGAASRAEAVLHGAVGPTVRAAHAAGDIDAWFFLRYASSPGARPQLRVRVHAVRRTGLDRFARRLESALTAARALADVVHVETADYHRESARYGGAAAMLAVEHVWQAESELALAIQDDPGAVELDPVDTVVLAMDALAAALGLDPAARAAFAAARRDAHGVPRGTADPFATDWRTRARRLAPALRRPPTVFARYRSAVTASASAAALAPSLPSLVHLTAIRLAGLDPTLEAHACYAWERALSAARHGDGLAY